MDRRLPLYLQIKNVLLDQINNGELLPGECIPSERTLASTFGVNRQTVRSAINVLIEDGILVKVPNKGNYVAKQIRKPAWGSFDNQNELRGLSQFLKDQGFNITSKVLISKKIEPTRSIRARLNLEEGSEVFCLARLRYTDGEPFAVEIVYLPYDLVEGIESYDFNQISLYDFMDTKDCRPCNFERALIVMFPDERVEKLLEMKNEPVYNFQYIGHDKYGRITEYTRSFMRSSKGVYRFII